MTKQISDFLAGTFEKMIRPEVDFGPVTQEDFDSEVLTVNAPWITSGSKLVCAVSGVPTVDHDADDGVVEGIIGSIQNIVPGVSFDLRASAPNGTWGKYKIGIIAVTPQ